MNDITTAAGAGLFLLVAGVLCIKFGNLPRAKNWMMLLAGACLAGAAGLIGTAFGWVTAGVQAASNIAGGVLIGGSLALIVAFVYGWIIVAHMHPKKGKPAKSTPWLALGFFPVMGALVGSIFLTVPDALREFIAQAGSNISGQLGL
jgi:hypothetical protein